MRPDRTTVQDECERCSPGVGLCSLLRGKVKQWSERRQHKVGSSAESADRSCGTSVALGSLHASRSISGRKARLTGSTTLEVRIHRQVEHIPGVAPQFEPLGVYVDIDGRVLHVAVGSLAERSGVRPFDKVLKVDGKLRQRELKLEILHKRNPVLTLERPDPDQQEGIALALGDADWGTALLSALQGDEAELLHAVRALETRGDATAPVVERRITERDVSAVALRVLALTGQPMEQRLPAGALLVEVALEHGHRHLVQMLLSSDLSEGYRAPELSAGSSSRGGGSSSRGGGSSSRGSSSSALFL